MLPTNLSPSALNAQHSAPQPLPRTQSRSTRSVPGVMLSTPLLLNAPRTQPRSTRSFPAYALNLSLAQRFSTLHRHHSTHAHTAILPSQPHTRMHLSAYSRWNASSASRTTLPPFASPRPLEQHRSHLRCAAQVYCFRSHLSFTSTPLAFSSSTSPAGSLRLMQPSNLISLREVRPLRSGNEVSS